RGFSGAGRLCRCADAGRRLLGWLAIRLARAGFGVERGPAGEQALWLKCELRPDVFVLDVMMPRLSGTEVLGALRDDAATAAIPVVLLSARAQEDDVERGLEAGADAYLAKPFQAPELIEVVSRLAGG